MTARYDAALDATAAHLATPEGCLASMMRWVATFPPDEQWAELKAMLDAWCARFGGTLE